MLQRQWSIFRIESAKQVRNTPLTTGGSFVGYCDEGKFLVVYDKNGTLYLVDSASYKTYTKMSLGLNSVPLHSPGSNIKVEVEMFNSQQRHCYGCTRRKLRGRLN